MAWKSSHGYVRIRHNGREEYEHRVVAERMLGRPLAPHEHVHHLNQQKDDNRPENLEVVDSRLHLRDHWQEGHYDERVRRQVLPHAECVRCGSFGRLRAKGMCTTCYHRDYYERHPEKWAKSS